MGVFDTQRNSFININPRLYPLVIKVWFPLMLLYEYLIYFDSILPILKRKMPLEIVLILFNQIFVGFFFFFFFFWNFKLSYCDTLYNDQRSS